MLIEEIRALVSLVCGLPYCPIVWGLGSNLESNARGVQEVDRIMGVCEEAEVRDILCKSERSAQHSTYVHGDAALGACNLSC